MEDLNSSNIGSGNKPRLLQLFVRLLDGKTKALRFSAPQVYGFQIKQRIFEATRIPTNVQRLLCSGCQVGDGASISQPDATVHLLLRLRGGKGGFGSLLRGAATKAGQKKTNNFDACRDMSGRRLRHVNAEKRLEEWRMEEEERKLEKIAEEFIKKKAKTGKKGAGDGEAQKYVEKYREESARCVEEVGLAVREACGSLRRKAKVAGNARSTDTEAKRLKIWMGKGKLAESDSDDTDEDSSDDEGNKEVEKSVVLNDGSQLDLNKETEGSSGSVTGGRHDAEFSGGGSCESGSEEEKDGLPQPSMESGKCSGAEYVSKEENCEPGVQDKKVRPLTSTSKLEAAAVGGHEACETEKHESAGPTSENPNAVVYQPSNFITSRNGEGVESKPAATEESSNTDIKSGTHEECGDVTRKDVKPEKPFNFDEFNSAAELEILGMEKLKSELQARGLKCGGTLQERAARLLLLKACPLEEIPKKLLAKK